MQLVRTFMLGLACCWALLAVPRLPQFQDRAEYTLVATIQLEKNPTRRLILLERWAQLYPQSAFRQERWNQFITSYRALGQPRKMREMARRMTLDNPSGVGTYWLTVLTVSSRDTSPAALQDGRRAAEALLRNAPTHFSPANCPSSVALADWYKERDRQSLLAHRTLGWVALQQKDYSEAVKELIRVTSANPYDAEAWFWLGSSLLGPGKADVQSKVMYCYARSLAVSGPGALLPEARRLVWPYFEHAYIALNGSDKGMSAFLQQASSGFKRE